MKILSSRRFALWWQLAMDWFQRQFAAIAASIDFTPVEEKLDEVSENVDDFRSTLMGSDGTTRIRPLVVAKIVSGGTEHCGFIAQVPDEDKQVIYDGVTPDTGLFFTATKAEGLLSASVGQTDSFPLGVKSGVEAFYPVSDWHVCTQAPQDITSDASTWQTAVVQVGEVWRCKEEHKYYNSSDEYIGSVYVYEKIGDDEITLGQIKTVVDTTAKESTAQEIKELVLREGIILANEYAETINDITGDFSNG